MLLFHCGSCYRIGVPYYSPKRIAGVPLPHFKEYDVIGVEGRNMM